MRSRRHCCRPGSTSAPCADPARFDAWLNRLLVRACYHVARSERRHEIAQIDVDTLDPPERHDAQADLALRDQIERGLQRLTTEQRAVLVLHHYLGMSDGEAATTLDIPIGTYKSRLSRGGRRPARRTRGG